MKEKLMTTEVVDWAADFLATDDEFLIPVKKLWLMAQGNQLATDLSLDVFHCLLEEDGRFEFDEGIDFGEGLDDPDVEREIMESHGYFSGPRVRLAAREITLDMIATAIKRSTDRMMAALQGAWEVRDQGDQEEETRLLDLLAHGQRLQQGLDEIFGGLTEQEDVEEADNP
jgi:hypothetical protein